MTTPVGGSFKDPRDKPVGQTKAERLAAEKRKPCRDGKPYRPPPAPEPIHEPMVIHPNAVPIVPAKDKFDTCDRCGGGLIPLTDPADLALDEKYHDLCHLLDTGGVALAATQYTKEEAMKILLDYVNMAERISMGRR